MGDTRGSEEVRGEKLTPLSPPFLGRERAAVSVDMYSEHFRATRTSRKNKETNRGESYIRWRLRPRFGVGWCCSITPARDRGRALPKTRVHRVVACAHARPREARMRQKIWLRRQQ